MFFDDKTACFVVKQAMDDKHRDQPTVSAALIYIENVFDRLDSGHTEEGEPGIMAKLSDEGLTKLAITAAVQCTHYPKKRVFDAAAGVYRGVRDFQKEMGVLGE